MKKIAKALLLVAMTVGMAVACDPAETSSSGSVSSASSLESSQTSLTSSDSTTSSSSNSSSSTSSNTSTSSSSSSSSASSSSSSSSSVAPTPTIVGISINTDNVKKSYNINENLDLTGLVVTAKYSDNNTKVVTDYTTNPANGTKFDTVGDKTVTVTYQGLSETFTVNVVRQLEGITLNTDNVKKYYHYGDALDLTGLVVTANYSDNTSEVVTDYTTNFANGAVLNEMFSATIVVTYGHLTSEFSVEVDYGDLMFNEEYIEAPHVYGEVFDTSRLTPYISYFDDTREEVATFTTTPADGSTFNKVGEFGIDWKATASDGRYWTGYFTIEVSPRAETGTKVTLDLSAAHTFENGVATEKAIGTVGSDYTPEFKLTKVSTAEAAMTIVNNKTRLMAGDTIENVNSLGGVTAIRVNGGSGNFRLYAGYTQDKMYEFMSAESESGDRIFNNIPSLNYFKFVGKYDNYPADIASIEFTYTRNENHELVDGVEIPIETLTVNEGEYIKGNKTLTVNGNKVSVDGKTYTYAGIVYNEALLYMNDNGGLLVKYVNNTAVVVTDTVDNYSSLTGQYTKVIGATEVKMFVNGNEVAANTEATRATMGLGDTFTFTATDNAVPSETPEITFVDESSSGEQDAFVGTYTAKGPIYLYDAMTGDTADVIVNKVVVTKENGEYYIDYSDTGDGFYPGFTGKVEAFISKGTKLCSYATDEITIIINTETKYIELGYYDVENYTFFADGSIGYTYESSNKATATFENGTVKALAEGNFYLSAKASNGLEAKYYVHVNGYVPAAITVSTGPFDLKVGDTYQINATVNEDATDKTLLFESNDKSVITVSETGLVTAIKEGSACVIVTSNDEEVWIGFNVKAATPKQTITTYTFEDENLEVFTLVVTEGESATISNGDDTYEFTFYNGKYYYDSDSNVAIKIRVSGSQAYLEFYDDNMTLFGYEGPITVFSDSDIFLTFVSSEQVDAQGQQGQGGQGGNQGQGGEQQQDVITTYTFDDENGESHTLVVTEGKFAVIDNTYRFTYVGGLFAYDEDNDVIFEIRVSGNAAYLDYVDENMVIFGYENFIITTWSADGTIELTKQ